MRRVRRTDVVGELAGAGEEARSSLRRTDWPIGFASFAPMAVLLLHRGGALLHRLDDVVIAGAAAQIAVEPFAHRPSRRGFGLRCARSIALMTMPGVQKPHCRPWHSLNAACIGCSSPLRGDAFDRRDLRAVACAASSMHDFTARPSRWIVHAPHWPVSQPTCVPVRFEVLAQELDQQRARIDGRRHGLAVDGQRTLRWSCGFSSAGVAAARRLGRSPGESNSILRILATPAASRCLRHARTLQCDASHVRTEAVTTRTSTRCADEPVPARRGLEEASVGVADDHRSDILAVGDVVHAHEPRRKRARRALRDTDAKVGDRVGRRGVAVPVVDVERPDVLHLDRRAKPRARAAASTRARRTPSAAARRAARARMHRAPAANRW